MMQIDFRNFNIHTLQSQNEFENQVIDFIKEWFSDSKTVSVQTSGSTGKPKILQVEKSKMRNSAKMTCDFLELKEGDFALVCLPLEYISGKMMVVRSIERKLNLIVAEPSLRPLEKFDFEIDFCAMTPLQVENSLDKIHLIKKLIIGGASVSEQLKSKINSQFNSQLSILNSQFYETYGMSETLSHIALKEIYPKKELYFKTLDDVEISLDERGCLEIFAPKLNAERLITNDLVEIKHFDSAQCSQKEFRFLGRIDNVINSGGVKIFPEELEHLVKKEIENEVVFLGIPDETLGQKLVLVIEIDASTPLSMIEQLQSQIANFHFEKKYHNPKEIIFVEQFPRTPNGKVLRNELLKLILREY